MVNIDLCQYSDIFGLPNKGIHSYRLFDFAIVDTVLTFLLAYVISYLFNSNYLLTLLFTFVLGFFLHYIFCVQTKLIRLVLG